MTEREKMLSGELYDPTDKELEQLRVNARKLARKYNSTDEDDQEEQAQILRKLLPATEELPYLQAPVYFDYGCNTFFGKFSSANFNFTCLDVCEIHIGDNVMIGPNVTLATPMHPLLPEERNISVAFDLLHTAGLISPCVVNENFRIHAKNFIQSIFSVDRKPCQIPHRINAVGFQSLDGAGTGHPEIRQR